MVADNLKILEDKIAERCNACGRKRSEILLIAVSKTQPVDVINDAISAGLSDFGENKAQELRDKSREISGDFHWHFIGHLQSNKIKYVINAAHFIHSVDSIKIAEEINDKAAQIDKLQNVLLEIKTSDEATKFGLGNVDEIFETVEYCRNARFLDPIGLMTMAPYTDDIDKIRYSFKHLRDIREKLNSAGYALKELSMGMSHDYEIAIEEGATMLRVGAAIFGERNY